MKISASVYSSKNQSVVEVVNELQQHAVDYLHIDCNDTITVIDDIKTIKQHCTTPIDLHIISPEPEKYVAAITPLQLSHVSFQYEHLPQQFSVSKAYAQHVGLAIMNHTPITVFEQYKNECSYVLLMTTTPGQSGGTFNKQTFERIRQFRKLYPSHQIQVDGGVNAEVSFILRTMGVDCAVVGSYLFSQQALGIALLNLKKDAVGSHFTVADFMLPLQDIPVVNSTQLSFKNILQQIENYKLTFTTVVNEQQQLVGIISNADVRKGLLQHIDNLNNINPEALINTTPIKIEAHQTLHQLFTVIKQYNFPVQYLPVVDTTNKLVGAITFNQLIKGEA